jgi:hypothetical protein
MSQVLCVCLFIASNLWCKARVTQSCSRQAVRYNWISLGPGEGVSDAREQLVVILQDNARHRGPFSLPCIPAHRWHARHESATCKVPTDLS